MNDNDYVDIKPEAAIIKNADATPYENIKAAAKAFGVDVKEPNKSCKYCHGRGYTGVNKVNNNEPIPCKCIYPDMNAATELAYDQREFVPRNRRERRYAQKLVRRMK